MIFLAFLVFSFFSINADISKKSLLTEKIKNEIEQDSYLNNVITNSKKSLNVILNNLDTPIDNYGNTLFTYAFNTGNLNLSKLLSEAGCDITKENYHNSNPLSHLEVYMNDPKYNEIRAWAKEKAVSMLKKGINKNNDKALQFLFRDIYFKNHPALIQPLSEPIIPLKIHQIWIGPRPLPEKIKWMTETWAKMHPNWEYKLWTNEDLETFDLINKEAFDEAINWGAKSDILRYEILAKHGGVYLDIDFECIKPLDPLHYNYSFYCCMVNESEAQVANGLIGCIPNHPVMHGCIDNIKKNKLKGTNNSNLIMEQTGPILITKIIGNYILEEKNRERFMTLIPMYFFPFPGDLRHSYWKGRLSLNTIKNNFLKPESFAIHYWATSWQV